MGDEYEDLTCLCFIFPFSVTLVPPNKVTEICTMDSLLVELKFDFVLS